MLGIVIILILVILVVLFLYISSCTGDRVYEIILAVLMTALLLGFGYIIFNDSVPTALDVYRGKTTLEITYKDSIPIDSVVVFK